MGTVQILNVSPFCTKIINLLLFLSVRYGKYYVMIGLETFTTCFVAYRPVSHVVKQKEPILGKS